MHWTPAVVALPEVQVVPLLVDVLPLLDALTAPVPLLLEALLPPVLPPPVAVKLTPPPQAAKARQSAPAATRVVARWFMVSFLGATPRPSPDGHGPGERSRKATLRNRRPRRPGEG